MKVLHAFYESGLNAIVKSDSLEVVKYLNKEIEDLSEVKNFFEVIDALAPRLGVLSFKHYPRLHNIVAH